MSLSKLFAGRIMKVNFNGEMARLPLEISCTATCEEIVEHMRGCVQRAFNLSDEQVKGLMLKYADEEGDLYTVTDKTLSDLAQLFPEGVIRIRATIDLPSAPAHHAEAIDAESTPEESIDGEQQTSSSQDGNQRPFSNPMAKLAAQFSSLWLPKVAAELQSAEKQAELDRVGKEKREQLLPAFKRLYERLEAVPGASYLKSKILPYIDGSDPDHLGSFVAELLQTLSASDAKDAVMGVVEDFTSSMMETHLSPMMEMFRQRSADMGMQAASSSDEAARVPTTPLMPDIAGLLGTVFAGNGRGRGMSDVPGVPAAACGRGTQSSMPTQEAPHTGPCSALDIAGQALHQTSLALHKTSLALHQTSLALHQTSPPLIPNISGLLGGIFAGKGLGKGMQIASTPTAGYGMEAQQSAPPPEASAPPPMPDMNAISAETTHESMFEQEVKDLMDMGFDCDEQVARDLLHVNNGDLSKVVDILTGAVPCPSWFLNPIILQSLAR